MLSKIKLELSIIESEESKKIPDLELDESGYSEKDRVLFMQLFIDNKACTSSEEHCLKTGGLPADVESFFLRSLYSNIDYHFELDKDESYFYPLNCNCGVPACAGIDVGVRVELSSETIEWFVDDEKTAKAFGANYFIFERTQFETELNKIKDFMMANKEVYIYPEEEPIKIGTLLGYWEDYLGKLKKV